MFRSCGTEMAESSLLSLRCLSRFALLLGLVAGLKSPVIKSFVPTELEGPNPDCFRCVACLALHCSWGLSAGLKSPVIKCFVPAELQWPHPDCFRCVACLPSHCCVSHVTASTFPPICGRSGDHRRMGRRWVLAVISTLRMLLQSIIGRRVDAGTKK